MPYSFRVPFFCETAEAVEAQGDAAEISMAFKSGGPKAAIQKAKEITANTRRRRAAKEERFVGKVVITEVFDTEGTHQAHDPSDFYGRRW